MFKLPALVLTAFLCATCALGQHRIAMSAGTGPSSSVPISVAPAGRRTSIGISGIPFRDGLRRRPFLRSPFLYGWPYFYSDYYDSYENEPPAPQPVPQAPAPQVKQEPLPDPVLLELRGDQWVRVTNFTMNASQVPGAAAQAQPRGIAKEIPPAILIYRDGHSEEVSSYSIIGRVMYTKADYWAGGSWTRSIQIADLDLPATLEQNQQRGVKFELPSGPDEVVIRP
jgi:hypothetical protein